MHVRVLRLSADVRRRGNPAANDLSRVLLLAVWGLTLGIDVHYSVAYVEHCKDLLSLLSEHSSTQADRNDIIELVDVVRAHRQQSLAQIREEIRTSAPRWMISSNDEGSIRAVLDFAVRLWLFVDPKLSDGTLTLGQVVERELPSPSSLPRRFSILTHDFCAKNLTWKAGIKIEWTSYLSDHLTFVGKSRLRVFRHVSALRKYTHSKESCLYPKGFLTETERTLSLLFPPANLATSKRTRRIGKKNHVDIEAAIESAVASDARLDLSNYPYWQERLWEVQKVYDKARPKTFKQWWFDRRNRFEWATFWTAVVVFVLTLVFGLIASITGILQAYAAFRNLR